MSRGVLYIASGSSFVEQAAKSAASFKNYHPELPVTIYTDEDIDNDIFDQVIQIDDPIEKMSDSRLSNDHFPYDKNLYLDADTYVCADISHLFDILDRVDLAVAHDIDRGNWTKHTYIQNGISIPEAFTEYNTGVIAYNDCTEVNDLFKKWNEVFNNYDWTIHKWGIEPSQPAFRVALYNSNIDFLSLPPEYNFMMHHVGLASGRVRILHQGPADVDLSEVKPKINELTQGRIWNARDNQVVHYSSNSVDVIQDIERILNYFDYK